MSINAKNEIIFTRLLYEKEEVRRSFITSLLKRDEYEEVLYWITEYYYSGFHKETWSLLWEVYYDFYTINYFHGEKTILHNYYWWKKENHIKYVLNVVKNLYYKRADGSVFCLRKYYEKLCENPKGVKNKIKWKTKISTIIKKFPKEVRNLLRSIDEKNYANICYFLKKWINKTQECYYWLCRYYFEKLDYLDETEKNKYLTVEETNNFDLSTLHMKNVFKKIKYNKIHILLSLVVYKDNAMTILDDESQNKDEPQKDEPQKDEPQIKKLKLRLVSNEKEIEYVENLNKFEQPSHYLLKKRREFMIYDTIGFNLPRFNNIPIWEAQWYHWIYYAYKCPLWRERINEFEGVPNHDEKTVVFPNDDKQEEFYQKYGLEPDEQPKEIQEMSIMEINKCELRDWFLSIFPENNILMEL